MNKPILYSNYNFLQKTDVNFVLENYLHLVTFQKGDSILDVGCGSGDVTTKHLLPRIPNTFKQLVGVDISKEMVRFATSQCIHSNISFMQMNIECKNIPETFKDNYHHIFSFFTLHWIQEQRQAFENLDKMLKPGGDMLLTFLAYNPVFYVYKNLALKTKWMEYMKNVQMFISPSHHCEQPDQVLKKLITNCGFSINLCSALERKYVYPNLEVFRKSMTAINSFPDNIPKDLHSDYLLDFINEMRTLNFVESSDNNNEEHVCLPYKLIVVVATKKRVDNVIAVEKKKIVKQINT